MRSEGLTDRYVKALTGMELPKGLTLERLNEEVGAFAELYTQRPELREALENPAFSEAERRDAITVVAGRLKVSQTTLNLINLLSDNKRTRLLPDIARGLGRHLDAQSGIARARVTSAAALPRPQLERLAEVLGRIRGTPVRVEADVDTTLIGGIVIELEGTVYDGSIRSRLTHLRDSILKEAP